MDLQHRFRHWPEAHDVVGDILRRTWENFRGSGMVSQEMFDVVLDLLRHFFFLESTGQLPRRVSLRLPWQEITAVLQKAFPASLLARLVPSFATTAVTERKKSVLRSLLCAGIPGDERKRLSVLFPPREFVRVLANECVTDELLVAFAGSLSSATPTPEVRPQVVRSPIPARGAQRSRVVRSPILPPMVLPPPRRLHAHPNPPTSPPPPSTTGTARRRLSVASTPPNVVTAVEPEPVTEPATVVAVGEDDEPGVQFGSEADEETVEDDAAVPVLPAAPVPAPVALTGAAGVPGEPGARLAAYAGEEVRAEPDVHVEANVGGEVAEVGTVAANVEEVVLVPSGNDALALLAEREIRLENVELEGCGLGDQPTPEEIFEQLVADELSATNAKDKLRVRLKRLGADPAMISNPFTTIALEDLAGVEAFFANAENVNAFENRISVSRKLNPKTEVTLNLYFREIFHALVCGKIALDVAYSLMETLIGAFAFLSRKVRPGPIQRANKAAISRFHMHLAQRKTVSLLMEYKAIMEAESQRQRDCHNRRTSSDAPPPTQRAMARCLAAKTAHTSNGLSKAVAILTSDGTAPGDPETLAKIVAKTPTDAGEFPDATRATIAEEGADAKNCVFFDPSKMSTAILACPNNSSSDIAGVCFEHVKSLLGRAHSGGSNHFLSFFSFLIEEIARDPDGKCFTALTRAKYIAIQKPKSSVQGDIRPIGITSVFRRIYGKYVMIDSGKLVGGILSSRKRNPQFAVGVSSGANILGLATNIMREVAPTHVSAAIDVTNAFNALKRPPLFEALSGKTFGAQKNFVVTTPSSRCPHGTALFSIALDFIVSAVFEEHGDRFPDVTSNWFADDGVASGPLEEVKKFITILTRELQSKAGLEVKFVTCLGGFDTDAASLLEPVEGLNWKNIPWSPGDKECGITVAGTPVGTAAYVRKEALAIVEKHQHRLDRIADFADHGEDGPRDFDKDFTTVGTRHLALTLLDYCCKHRFDYVTHLISKEILGDGLIEHVQRSIHSCFSRICDGEIQFQLLDEVGKQLMALPLRYGGQAIHDIGFEADISLVSTLHALSPDIVRRIPELHRKKLKLGFRV
ncbi:unnamed protein product [Bathycoccus prasinos]